MIELPDGTLMCGTENDGLIHVNKDGSVIHHYLYNKTDTKGILGNSIWSLFLDSSERIWVGYYNAGVAIYDKRHDKFKEIENIYNNSNSLIFNPYLLIVNKIFGQELGAVVFLY